QMARGASTEPPPRTILTTQPTDVPSRNPVPLSATQENEVRQTYYKRVRAQCADLIREYATCTTGRTITASWKCRQQRLAMNSCMLSKATLEEQDRAREEWFQTREQRKREKEEKDRERKEN
ncbi:cytochrome c oxidase biogenesis protein Cmc1 like-domain-containing protein, partial [Lineolata rhizophorae]